MKLPPIVARGADSHLPHCACKITVQPLKSLKQTAVEYLESSDSEGGGDDAADGEGKEEGKEDEEADRREEARVQKLWVKRAKRRRVLAEVEQSATGGDSQGPELLMQEVGKTLHMFLFLYLLLHLVFSRLVQTEDAQVGNDSARSSKNSSQIPTPFPLACLSNEYVAAYTYPPQVV